MSAILIRAACFICIILLGYGLKRIGMFHEEDFVIISKLVIRITLTAVIVVNFAGREIDMSMLFLTAIGLGFGLFLMAAMYILSRNKPREEKAFSVLNVAGCNIGNFALPFAQGFLGPTGVMAVSLFDCGNSFICLGGACSVASMIKNGQRFSIKPLAKALGKSAPFVTYILVTVLCLLHIDIPAPIVEYAGIISNANAFLAMFMIGIGFHINTNGGSQIKTILKILSLRYAVGIALALASWFVLPLPHEIRQALVILFLTPVASAAPGFTETIGCDYALASAINSISLVISIVLITSSLIVIL